MKRFKVNIHLKEWTCGDGCCSERQADIEIFDDNNFIIDDSYVFYRKIFLQRFLDKGNYRFP
jgi:hypothetical protein